MGVCFDMLGIVFRGKCYMNTLPFARIGIWGFSFFVSLLTLCFGGPGVLDQGADFTLRDSDVPQTLKKIIIIMISVVILGLGFLNKHEFATLFLEGPLHCHKVEKRPRTLFYVVCKVHGM